MWVIKSRRKGWAGHMACMGKIRNSYLILIGKPKGKISLVRSGRRWEGNIEIHLN
jgi:hypothetical protein